MQGQASEDPEIKRQGILDSGRRRGWDVSREQHRNIYYLG